MIKLINIQRAPGWRGLKYGYRLTAEETRASDDVCAELSVVRARRRAIEDATDAERGSEMRLNYGLAGTCCKRWRCNRMDHGKKRRKVSESYTWNFWTLTASSGKVPASNGCR